MGNFWLLMNPCIPVILYNLLQYLGVFSNNQDGIPRAVYLTLGLIVYYTFSESLSKLTSCCTGNRVFLLAGGVQKSAVIMATLLEVVFNFLIRYTLYIILLIANDFPILDALIFVPALALFPILLGGGLGIFLSVFDVISRDISNAVNMICFYLLFGSGVFSAIERSNLFFTILSYSPIYLVIDFCRDLVFWDGANLTRPLLVSMCAAVAIFIMSLVGFYRVESKINSYL